MFFLFINAVCSNKTFRLISNFVENNFFSYKHLNADPSCQTGTIFIESQHPTAHVCLIECSFINIRDQAAEGGALYINNIDEPERTNIIESCTFRNCSAVNGGAIFISQQMQSLTNFTNCNFQNNTCSKLGGSIYTKSSNISFSYCKFTDNSSLSLLSSQSYFYGGSIYFDQSNGSIQNCYFSNSSFRVIYDGYGICIYLKSSNISINNCSFEFNSATTESANIYGTLYIYYSNVTLYQCNFISNNISALKTYSSCFGCAIYFTESSTEIIESNFISNSVNSKEKAQNAVGGAIWLFHTKLLINSSLFKSNCAESYSTFSANGGAINIQSSPCSFFYSNFTENFCIGSQQTSQSNGCISYVLSSEVNFSFCNFVRNSLKNSLSKSKVGGVLLHSSNGTFSRCLFKNNEGPSGAAIYVNSISAIIEFCSFIKNYATHGSDVYFMSSDFLKIANCKFEKNCANDLNTKSLIYLSYTSSMKSTSEFINNEIVFYYPNQIKIFDGRTLSEYILSWNFKNNCFYPYDSDLFISQTFNLTNENGDTITIDMAFNKYCIYQSSSFVLVTFPFTKSSMFSKSELFSSSMHFSASSYFTKSNPFSKSDAFSLSLSFSNSKIFSNSHQFSPSNFIKTNAFSKSSIFSESLSFSRIKTDFDPIFESETSSFINSDIETSSKFTIFVTNYDYYSNSFSSLEIISNIFINNSNEQSIFYTESLSDSNLIFDSKSYIDNEGY